MYLFAHLPLVILLTFGTVVLHHWHVFDVTDSFFMRWAVQDYLMAPELAKPRSKPEDRIQLLEATAAMRIKELELEPEGANADDIERVGGVRPIDRTRLAGVLDQLASRIEERAAQPGAGRPPRVIAIDVDVTPLGVAGDMAAMQAALDRLRKHATVVALVMERRSEPLRSARNAFMVSAGCTRTGAPPAAGVHPLYFASPSIFPERFRNFQTFAMHFPFKAKPGLPGTKFQPTDTHFPSLSNLLHLSMKSGTGPSPSALTLLCDQASRTDTKGLLLQDLAMLAEPSSPAQDTGGDRFDDSRYVEVATNWGLQKTDLIGWTTLDSKASLRDASSPGRVDIDSLLDLGAVLFSVDGGASHDKFSVPSISHTPVSGALVHALQALSASEERDLDTHAASFPVDIVIGCLFVLIWWSPFVQGGWYVLPHALQPIYHAIIPALLACLCAGVYVKFVAPYLLGWNLWATPAYVLAGLVLHAYVEAADKPGGHHEEADFTFGLSASLPPYDPEILTMELRGIQIAAGIRWAVLLWGGYLLVEEGPAGIAIAAAVLATVIVAFVRPRFKGVQDVLKPQQG